MKTTLREEILVEINFRKFFVGHFTVIDFSELGFTNEFAGIIFGELGLTKDFTGIIL